MVVLPLLRFWNALKKLMNEIHMVRIKRKEIYNFNEIEDRWLDWYTKKESIFQNIEKERIKIKTKLDNLLLK